MNKITIDNISLGNRPSYYIARMEGNGTGVGTSYFQGTTTQRTVSMDFITENYLFIKGHAGAGKMGLSLFFLKEGEKVAFH